MGTSETSFQQDGYGLFALPVRNAFPPGIEDQMTYIASGKGTSSVTAEDRFAAVAREMANLATATQVLFEPCGSSCFLALLRSEATTTSSTSLLHRLLGTTKMFADVIKCSEKTADLGRVSGLWF